jgi:hypothetical protein
MRKKGAISLPINILVIIVISLVIFGGAMTLLYKMVAGAESAKADLDQKTEAELRRLLEIESKRVALPLHTAYLSPGEFHSFGLGILNIAPEASFDITVSLNKAIDEEDEPIIFDFSDWELLFLSGPYLIEENEYELIPIGITVPKTASKGTYIFDVKVFKDTEQYDNTKKFYVVVK